MSFFDDVRQALEPVLNECGFKLSPFVSDSSYLVYVRRSSSRVGQYLFARDNRAKGGDVEFFLWIAPIEFPDDRISALGIGVQLLVYSEFEIDDSKVDRIGQKIRLLSSHTADLVSMVERELDHPVFETRRQNIYFASTALFHAGASSTDTAVAEAFKAVESKVPGIDNPNSILNECETIVKRIDLTGRDGETIARFDLARRASLLAHRCCAELFIT